MEPPVLSFNSAMNIIVRWNSEPAEGLITDGDRSEIRQYLQAFETIQLSMGVTDYQSQAEEGIRMAVARLKHVFLILLTRVTDENRISSSITESSSMSESSSMTVSSGLETHIAHDRTLMNDLRRIARRMKSAGYVGECVEVYKSVRKPFVDTRFGIHKFSAGDVRGFVRDELQVNIRKWMNAARVCRESLCPREWNLCGEIFENGEADVCFAETVKDAVIRLFQFAEAVSATHRSHEKLFTILDMYKALVGLSRVIDGVFRNEFPLGPPPSRRLTDKFVEMVRGILSEFEKAVFHELSPMTEDDRGGAIHRLTKYAVGFIHEIVRWKEILSEIIVSEPSFGGDLMLPDADLVHFKGQTPMVQHLILIIAVLQMNLEGKSKYYKDECLVHLFMTNNVHYIVQQMHSSGAEEMIGEGYKKRLIENVRQAISSYQRSTCERILSCLGDRGTHPREQFYFFRSSGKKKIKLFNAMLEELLSTQATWAVPDLHLRQVLHSSILKKLIPAYSSFLELFSSHTEKRNHPYMVNSIIKYSVEDVQTLISENLFKHDHVGEPPFLLTSRQEKFSEIIEGGQDWLI